VTFTTTSGPFAVDLATPMLAGLGQSATLELTSPLGCTSTVPGYCDFRIDADVGNRVTESDETNNGAMGSCGPIFL
jgi:subtilase family serine protease